MNEVKEMKKIRLRALVIGTLLSVSTATLVGCSAKETSFAPAAGADDKRNTQDENNSL
jgi:hypothetical protein